MKHRKFLVCLVCVCVCLTIGKLCNLTILIIGGWGRSALRPHSFRQYYLAQFPYLKTSTVQLYSTVAELLVGTMNMYILVYSEFVELLNCCVIKTSFCY